MFIDGWPGTPAFNFDNPSNTFGCFLQITFMSVQANQKINTADVGLCQDLSEGNLHRKSVIFAIIIMLNLHYKHFFFNGRLTNRLLNFFSHCPTTLKSFPYLNFAYFARASSPWKRQGKRENPFPDLEKSWNLK